MTLRSEIRQAIADGISAEEDPKEITERVMKVLNRTEVHLRWD